MNARSLVTIVTRIYDPEPAAAAFRLAAVATSSIDAGTAVRVLTTTFERAPDERSEMLTVLRWPVLRDAKGYVRGYLPYLSFDVPLFFRMLGGRRPAATLVEPPPTTGVVARLACLVRRVPYVWYAADIWSDAAASTGAPRPVVAVVRAMERFSLRGAAAVIAVSDGVAERARDLGGRNVKVIPNGADTSVYNLKVQPLPEAELAALGVTKPYFLYAGTASEWQDAQVFAQAFLDQPDLVERFQLVYVGGGSQWKELEALREAGPAGAIVLLDPVSAERVASLLRGARTALVSVAPGKNYDFAYPTKVLAALACGTPVLYAGPGVAGTDVKAGGFGIVSPLTKERVTGALRQIVDLPWEQERARAAHNWVLENRSLTRVGDQAADLLRQVGGVRPAGLLVVLTNQYPANRGDAPFLQTEMDALASRFDRVVVLSREDVGNPLPLPENVTYGGTFAAPRRTLLRALASPITWRSAMRAAVDEARSGRRRRQPLRAAAEILAGIKFAHVIKKQARAGEPVTVYAYWGVAGAQALPFLPTEYRKVVRLHGGDLYEETPELPLRVPIFNSADAILVASEHGKKYLQTAFPHLFADNRVQVSRLGTPAASTVTRPHSGRSPGHSSEGTVSVVSCSTVNQNKRVEEILRAVQAASRSRSVRWTHIGSGPLLPDLERLVREAGNTHANLEVHLAGHLTPTQVAAFHARHPAHVFVNLSDSEGIPVSVMEALAAGIPAVVTDAGGSGELVNPDLGSGILLPLRPSAQTVADAILKVADNRSGYQARKVWAQLANSEETGRRAAELVSSHPLTSPNRSADPPLSNRSPRQNGFTRLDRPEPDGLQQEDG